MKLRGDDGATLYERGVEAREKSDLVNAPAAVTPAEYVVRWEKSTFAITNVLSLEEAKHTLKRLRLCGCRGAYVALLTRVEE